MRGTPAHTTSKAINIYHPANYFITHRTYISIYDYILLDVGLDDKIKFNVKNNARVYGANTRSQRTRQETAVYACFDALNFRRTLL